MEIKWEAAEHYHEIIYKYQMPRTKLTLARSRNSEITLSKYFFSKINIPQDVLMLTLTLTAEKHKFLKRNHKAVYMLYDGNFLPLQGREKKRRL